MHIVPYTHADYAWTHTRQWHAERGALILNEVLETMEKNTDLTYCIDSFNHLLEPFLEAFPHKKELLKKYVLQGRIEITGGIIGLVRPTQIGGEIFIRNMQIGRQRFYDELGNFPINAYMNVDVSIGHRQIPQLMSLAGIKYYRGWRPQGAMDYMKVPRAFYYEGIDKTKVLVTRGSYVGFCNVKYLNDACDNYEKTAQTFYHCELENIIKRNNVDNVWISHGMDDTRVLMDFDDTPVDIDGFVKLWNQNEQAKLIFDTPTKFFESVEKEKLPTVDYPLDTADVAYNMPSKGQNGLWLKRILLERLLCCTESLCTIAAQFGFEYPQCKFSRMWEALCLLSSHATDFLFHEDTEVLNNKAQWIKSTCLDIMDRAKGFVMSKIKTNEKTIVIFNTTTKEREEYAQIDISFPYGESSFMLVDADGNSIDYQTIYTIRGDVSYNGTAFDCARVLAKVKVPPMGYSCIFVKSASSCAGGANFNLTGGDVDYKLTGGAVEHISNGVYDIDFEGGRIVKISQNGKVVFDINNSSPICDLKFVNIKRRTDCGWLYFNNIEKIDNMVVESWEFKKLGPIVWEHICYGKIGQTRVKLTTIIFKDSKKIDFDLELVIPDRLHGYFKTDFPTSDVPEFVGGIPFGTEEKNIDKVAYGSVTEVPTDNIERLIKGVFVSQNFLSFKGACGLNQSIINNTTGYYYIYDEDKKTVGNILSRVMDIEKMNNWESYAHSDIVCVGRHNFKFSFVPNADTLGDTINMHKNISAPLELGTKYSSYEGGSLACEYSLVGAKNPNFVVSAFTRENGKNLVRLYEADGKDSTLELEFANPLAQIRAVDFFGNDISKQFKVSGNKASVKVRAHEIINIEFSF